MTAQNLIFEIPPFPAFPAVSRYVAVGSLEESLQRIRRSIDACEGLSLVIGPPGTGKSLLGAVLTREYSDSHDVVTLGETPIEDAATFYRHLLHHLGVELASIEDGDLQLAIVNRVRNTGATRKGLLILVDEAQSLSAEVLEAIRMTTNIMDNGQPRVYAVVCGGPKLDDTLALPALEPLTQRVAVRCYLHPLNANETRQYISDSIVQCGGVPEETISDEAMAAVHHACCGVPRLINQLVTSAIDVAADADQNCISDTVVDRAWADLQQLPSPMIEEPSLRRESSTIEFGELDGGSSFDFASETAAITHQSEDEVEAESEQTCEIACEDSCEDSCEEPCESVCGSQDLKLCSEDDVSDITVSDEADLQFLEEDESDLEPTQEYTIAPNSLFGDFDHEEEVQLGNGVVVDTIKHHDAPIDFESMLHSEIVGIASDASSASGYDRDDQESFPYSERAVGFTEQNSVQWLEEVEGTDSLIDDDSDIVIHDDSDMLVIEDDVDLRLIDSTPRIDTEETIVSVDFQAMLSRMRHGIAKEAS